MKSNKNLNKVMVSVWLSNYVSGDNTQATFVDRETFEKFKPIIKTIRDNAKNKTWNWWDRLPERWNAQEHKFEPDTWSIKNSFTINFNEPFISASDIIKFFKKFTPNGAGAIRDIKVYEYKLIEL